VDDTVRVVQDEVDHSWWWERVAPNNEKIMRSTETYESFDHCLDNVRSTCMPPYTVRWPGGGPVRYHLKAVGGSVVLLGPSGFEEIVSDKE
jgi:hypothetical protein